MNRRGENVKKFIAAQRAEFVLKQRIERITWEENVFRPELAKFLGQAYLPEPEARLVEIEWVDDSPPKRTPRMRSSGPKKRVA